MKRSLGTLTLLLVAGAVFAQAPFTIVRPANDSKVREGVKVLLPKGCIPDAGYIGIFLDGKFIEATMPTLKGKYYEYIIDTKGRSIEDGTHKLEVVLYVDYKDQPRIVERSSVDIKVANKANINVPNSGIKLRYGFYSGKQWIYGMTQKVTMDTISESENKKGGKAAELPLDEEKVRLLYAVDNAYGDGSGLIRMQALPTKGKDYAYLTINAQEGVKKYNDYDMAPVYMRVTSTGKEIFGAVPPYFPLSGTTGDTNLLDLFAAFPLPMLPTKSIRPGDSWPAKFQNGKLDLEKVFEQTSLVKSFDARGEFIGVEWEMGHPCAKIENSIAVAELSDQDKKDLKGGASQAGEKVSLKETIWFALDTKQVLKVIRDQTIETKVDGGGLGFGGGAPGGPSGGFPGAGYPGAGRPGAAGGGATAGNEKSHQPLVDISRSEPSTPLNQRGGRRGGGFPGAGAPGAGAPAGGFPGAGFPGAGRPGQGGFGGPGFGGAATQPQAQFVRIRIQRVFTLEQ